MYHKGDLVTFGQHQFVYVEARFVQGQQKQRFIYRLLFASILFIAIFIAITIPLFGAGYQQDFDVLWILGAVLFYVLYVPIHELIHGISAILWSNHSWTQLRFGIIWTQGLAYCIAIVPISVKRARYSLWMPLLVVCIPIYIYGIVSSNMMLAIYAILLAAGSVGDFYYLWTLRHTKNTDYMLEELPTANGYTIGYHVFRRQEEV